MGEAIVATMFPEGEQGRIPLIAVAGAGSIANTTNCIGHILRGTWECVGITNSEGTFVNEHQIDTGDCSGPQSARVLLLNPQVEAAVCETGYQGILQEGLGFDYCHVALISGHGDHDAQIQARSASECISHGDHDAGDLDHELLAARVLIESVPSTGTAVLDARHAALAAHCAGSVILFAADPNHPVVAEHRNKGGRTVFIREAEIVAADGERESRIVSLDSIPSLRGWQADFQPHHVLSAAAAAWAAGLTLDAIRARLETFAVPQTSETLTSDKSRLNGSHAALSNGQYVPSSLPAKVP